MEEDCLTNLLSTDQELWFTSLVQLRIATIAHFDDPQHNPLPLIHQNLIRKLKSFLQPSANPTFLLDASIICATLLKKPETLFTEKPLRTLIVHHLIDALTNNEDKSTIYSLFIALSEVASSDHDRIYEMFQRDILNLLLTHHTKAQGDIDTIRAIMRLLSCIFFEQFERKLGIPTPLFVLPVVSASLHSPDIRTMSYAASTISCFLEYSSQQVTIADATIAPTLTQLMLHPAKEVVRPALSAVGNLMTGDDDQTETMINFQVVPSLLWLVDYPDKKVQKDALWTLSNITAGNQQQIQSVIDAGVIPKVIPLLANLGKETKEEKDLCIETVWLLGNICEGGSSDQKIFLLNEMLLERFYQLLKRHTEIEDRMIIKVLIHTIEFLVEEGLQTENDSCRTYVKMFVKENHVEKFFENLEQTIGLIDPWRIFDILQSYKKDENEN